MTAVQSTIMTPMVKKEIRQARPVEVVVIDHSYLHMINWAEQFAKSVKDVNVVLVTDKLPSRVEVGFEVINVHGVAQNLTFEELERKLNFSLYRSLLAERAYFDYTNFTKSECYSRLSLDEIEKRVRPHINALDAAISTRGDLVIGHMADNAIASLAAHISHRYGKPYVASTPSYWRPDALFIRDRVDQTSSRVDELYRHYYANQSLIDRSRIQTARSSKRYSHIHSDINVYSLKDRIKKVISSQGWHDPFSPINWVIRRANRLVSRAMIALFGGVLADVPPEKKYVLYPMHVAPEAALLGSTPELADQFSLIKNISINLPWGVRLCVKVHPAQGQWTGPHFDFYRRLASLKNVDVISRKVPAEKILRDPNCIAVAVINGTLGLEAAVHHKPVFVFGRAIFGVADCFLKPKDFEEFQQQMMSILGGRFEFDEGAMWSILAALDAAVWQGDVEFGLAESGREAALQTFSVFERYIRSEVWRNAARESGENDGRENRGLVTN